MKKKRVKILCMALFVLLVGALSLWVCVRKAVRQWQAIDAHRWFEGWEHMEIYKDSE